jgi:nicotinamide mononucleotide transporter
LSLYDPDMNAFFEWAFSHKIELVATLFGLVYILLSIRQHIFTWPAGIITSVLYCVVFFEAKFYAGMGLQFYYVIISGYGWWSWSRGSQKGKASERLYVSHTATNLWIRLFILNLFLTLLMYFLLGSYTDSPLPFGDAFTTSLSIIATWMLARKKIEHWLIWIFIDLVCISLYLYKGLYPTVFLFAVYTLMAGIGFYEWRKESEKMPC